MSNAQVSLYGAYAGFDLKLAEQGIAILRFNQPEKLNAFSASMKRDMLESLFHIGISSGARALIISGDGGVFSAGDNFRNYYDQEPVRSVPIGAREEGGAALYSRLRMISQQLNRTLRDLDIVTIAAIEGPCVQSALSLALCCDFRIVSREARLGSATLRFGFQPDENGHYLLVQHIGLAKTLDFLLRKRFVSGEEAVQWGLATDVVPEGESMTRAVALAREMVEGPQSAMRLLKRAIYNAAEYSFDQAADDIATKTAISDLHPDTKEGVTAFREKRKPDFQ